MRFSQANLWLLLILGLIAMPTFIWAGRLKSKPPELFTAGEKANIETWEAKRPALIKLFEANIYGRPLPQANGIRHQTMHREFANIVRTSVEFEITAPHGKLIVPVRIFSPRSTTPVPVVIFIDHRNLVTNEPNQTSDYLPIEQINSRGYAVAVFKAEDVAPDEWLFGLYRSKLINLFFAQNEELPADQGRTISAWAWMVSRTVDYLITDKRFDPKKILVAGHSRGGKTALWAGANDPRISVVFSNQSGSTGAKLARFSGGESVARINLVFPHWFAGKYKSFSFRESKLPVDQHQLLALIAPRALYIGSAAKDWNANPRAELLSLQKAVPVFQLYSTQPISLDVKWPPQRNKSYHSLPLGYRLRDGSHDILRSDWSHFLDFADKVLKQE